MCRSCGRRAGAAGGVLISCTECPACFCEEHEPDEGAVLDSSGNDRWAALGMKKSRTTYFCRCSSQCVRFNKTRVEKGTRAAIDQVNLEIAKENKKRTKSKKKQSGTKKKEEEYINRPVIPPRHGTPGEVEDYDGHRWYICRSNETPGQVSWEMDVDCAQLVYQNQNISGLGRSSKLMESTPLMLGRGESDFLSEKEANLLLRSDPNFKRPTKKRKRKKSPSSNSAPKATVSREVKQLREEFLQIYGRATSISLITKLKRYMPFSTKVFQIANCSPTYPTIWLGEWEDCYVVRVDKDKSLMDCIILSDHTQIKNVPMRHVRNEE